MSRKNNSHDDLQSALSVYKTVYAKVRAKQTRMSNYAKNLVEETGKDALLSVVKNHIAELCMKYYEDPATAMAKTIEEFMIGKPLCRFRKDLSSERDSTRDYRPTLVFEVGEYGHQIIVHPARYHSMSGDRILESIYESLRQDTSVSEMVDVIFMSNHDGAYILFGRSPHSDVN